MSLPAVVPPLPIAPQADLELIQLAAEGSRHASVANTSPFAFALDMLGDIDLPPGSETRVDRAQMRGLGALYLAADLEPAGIIPAAETLAALAATGALHVDLGPVTGPLHQFWRDRHDRLDAAERTAFYGRLFGASYGVAPADGPINEAFEPLMLELCEALYRLDEQLSASVHGGTAGSTRVRAAARNLLANLVDAGGGATPFLAAELMATLNEALAILKHPHLRGLFASRDIWDVVAAVHRHARRRSDDPRVFVRRGRAGMSVIVWLADAAEALRQYGKPLVRLDDPVVVSAVEWLQSSLAISELQARSGAPATPGPPEPASPWAKLGI
jgi:hypothetical protein